MNPVYEKLKKCLNSVKEKVDFVRRSRWYWEAVWEIYADQMEIAATVDYRDIEGFPVSTAPGHKGPFCLRLCEGCPLWWSCRGEFTIMRAMI